MMSTSKAHFEAIGRVAYEWSRLEINVQLYIGAIVGLPPNESLILTNPANMKTWLDMLQRLIPEKFSDETIREDFLERFKKLKTSITDKTDSLASRRNRVIHGLWSLSLEELFGEEYEPDEPAVATVKILNKAGKKMMVDMQMTASEVRAIATEIRAATHEFLKIGQALIDALRRKQRPPSP